MSSSFRVVGLDAAEFVPLFALGDDELHARGAVRRIADAHPGFPCRVSLEDAAIGDELLLLPYEHHAVDSPYRAAGPIFVRRHATPRTLDTGELPDSLTRRVISLRGYDRAHMMVHATVCDGTDLRTEIGNAFAHSQVEYLHLHNAKPGCYACTVLREA